MKRCESDRRKHSLVSDESSESSRKFGASMKRKDIKKCLFICSFAFMFNYSAYAGLVFLQSSMNIEDGLGTVTLFAIYATSSISTILFVPLLIDFKGAKAAIVLGELGITAFTMANFYPSWFTMIPIAIFHGLTESASWAGAAVYVTYLGEQYWKRKRGLSSCSKTNRKQESYVYRFISVFYVFVYLSQVIGNALVYLFLFGLKDMETNKFNESSLMTSSGISSDANINNSTESLVNSVFQLDSWEYCGAQECQSEYIYDDESEKLLKYKPNPLSVYILLGIFLLVQFIFTSVHAFALPKIPSKFEMYSEEKKTVITSREDEDPIVLKEVPNRSILVRSAVRTELRETFRHIVSPLHLLVFPLIFYCGVFIAFNITEFTRAYVSCTIGVEKIGLVMVVYGLTSMSASFVSIKLLPLFGRNVMYSVVAVMHVSVYLVCLLWKPNIETSWVVYTIAASLGICDGVITTTLQGMIAVYFQDRLGIAFSVKNFATNLGIMAGAGISTSLCVYVKIYLLLILLGLSSLLYLGAEVLRLKSPSKINLKDAKRSIY